LDERKVPVLVTIDLSKAFDPVWHSTLFHKLLALSLPPCFVRWTRSFCSTEEQISSSAVFEAVRPKKTRCSPGLCPWPGPLHFTYRQPRWTLPQGTNHSLYADSHSMLTHTLKWRFSGNPAKCEC